MSCHRQPRCEPLEGRRLLSLGAYALVEGQAAGGDSDIVATTGAWNATSNNAWLHTSSSGTGNGLATFTFDANPGPMRTGTLTIAGSTLTVTQAGVGYLAAGRVTLVSSGLNDVLFGVGVDSLGDVYVADTGNNVVREWNATSQAVTTLVSSGLTSPYAVAVDGSGNVYIADTYDNAVKEWIAASGTLTTLVPSSAGLRMPEGVAVDSSGNVYIADTDNDVIKEWNVSTKTLSTLTPLATGLVFPEGVAVDAAGNVYIADTGNNAVREWNATTHAVSILVSSGLNGPCAVAVDGSGIVYIADAGNRSVKVWNPTSQAVATLVSSGVNPGGIAVDGSGDVYLSDNGSGSIHELPRSFVPGGPILEGSAAGSDALPPVLPSGESLTGIFAPTSDQNWLTIGAVSGGAVNFSFTANTGAARTAHITLLGQQIAVTQAGIPPGNLAVFSPSAGYWYLDTSGTGQWTTSDSVAAFNEPDAAPVVGDWEGSGRTELGFYLNGTWWLQTASGIETFSFGFSGSNVIPVVGDWNAGGKTEVGVYCNGAWFLDYDGSHIWDATNQAHVGYLGWNDGGTNSVIPVPGNWAGDAKTEMGVYCQGAWFLDSTGSGKWDGTSSDWGWAGSLIPVAGNWSDSGTKDQFGVYSQGVWFRDADGTHTWDAANQAATAYFGWSGAAGGGRLARRHAGAGRRQRQRRFRRLPHGPEPGDSIGRRPAG